MSLKKLIITIFFGILVMSGLVYYTGAEKFLNAFSQFSFKSILLVAFLSLLNYFFRFLKWQIYLKTLEININPWISFKIFMSGMLMSMTPGKMGEVFKSLILKDVSDTPILKSAPIILVERLTDLAAIIFLSMAGMFMADFNYISVIIAALLMLFTIVFLSSERIGNFISSFFGKYSKNLQEVFVSARILMKPWQMGITTLLSIISWFMECVGFYILILPFSNNVSLLEAVYIYAICTLLGALSMLPGGLAATEAGMTYFLAGKGIALGTAGAITFVIRLLTLWFAIILAALFFFSSFNVKNIVKLATSFRDKTENKLEDESQNLEQI